MFACTKQRLQPMKRPLCALFHSIHSYSHAITNRSIDWNSTNRLLEKCRATTFMLTISLNKLLGEYKRLVCTQRERESRRKGEKKRNLAQNIRMKRVVRERLREIMIEKTMALNDTPFFKKKKERKSCEGNGTTKNAHLYNGNDATVVWVFHWMMQRDGNIVQIPCSFTWHKWINTFSIDFFSLFLSLCVVVSLYHSAFFAMKLRRMSIPNHRIQSVCWVSTHPLEWNLPADVFSMCVFSLSLLCAMYFLCVRLSRRHSSDTFYCMCFIFNGRVLTQQLCLSLVAAF